MTEIEHNLAFQRRPGTFNHGGDYELNLTALYAIKLALDDDVQTARIASNVNKYGAFDDIVARVEYKNGTTTLYTIQLKHKDNPHQPISFINKAKGDFSLEKYKNSFHDDIKSGVLGTDRDHLSEGVGLENVVSCLLTNAPMPKNTDNIYLDKRASLSCKALRSPETDFIDTTSEGYHTFKMHTQQPQFATFLISYLFSGYQKSYDEAIKKLEAKKIGECFKNELKTRIRTDEVNFHDMLAGINVSMRESFKQVGSDLLEKTLKEVSDYFRAEYQTAEGIYQRYPTTCEEYSEFFQKFRFYGGQLKNKDVIEAITSRIEKSIGKPQPNVAKKFIKFVRCYFGNGRLLTTQQIKMKLLELMLPSSLSKDELEDRFRVFQTVTDLNDSDQKLVVSKYIKVAVQGRKEMGLLDVVDPAFCQQLDPEFLFKHMGSVIHVGKHFEFKLRGNYIKRKFHKMRWSEEHFQSVGSQTARSGSDAFILSISEKDVRARSILHELKYIDLRIRKYLPRDFFGTHILISNESDADKRAEALVKSCVAEVECFHYLKGPSLEWKGSRNKATFEKRRNKSPQSFCYAIEDNWKSLEEKDLHDFISIVNIITGGPGMGKSALLDSLIGHCPSNKWVLKLNLKECEEDLRDKLQEILQDPVQYMYDKSRGNCNDEFSNLLFRHMKSKNAITVFIDDFDKISIDDEAVLRLVAKLEQLEVRTWIFVRPNTKEDCLEEKFNVKAIRIKLLSNDDITDYLRKHVEIDEPILKSYLAEIGNIVDVPLNLKIVSDILTENNLDNLQVTDLYEKFVNKKCEMFSGEFAGIDLIRDYQILSLLQIYGFNFLIENDITTLDEIERLLKVTGRYISVIGLVSSKVSDSIPTFCHQALAKCLTAKWLSSNTNHKAFKPMYQRLFEPKFRNVRLLFDKIVTRDYPLHAAIVDSNLELTRQLCDAANSCDGLSRSPLHLAMSYFTDEYKHVLFKRNERACKIADEICKRCSDGMIKKKDCFGWSSKDYAKMSARTNLILLISCYWGCSAVTAMCFSEEKTKFWNRTKTIKMNLNNALRYAYERGHLECLKLLLQQELKIAGTSKSDEFNLGVKIFFQFTNININLTPQLLNLLVFFIVNEGPFGTDVLLKFQQEFGYFYDLPSFPLSEDMEKELIQSCKKSFKSLEERLGLTKVRQLNIEGREDVVIKMVLSGCTPLYAAIWCDHINAVRVLVNSCDVNEISRDKFIPFHCAVQRGNIDIIKLLIDAGANVNQVNSDGNTALNDFYENCGVSSDNTFLEDFYENSLPDSNSSTSQKDLFEKNIRRLKNFRIKTDFFGLLISKAADPTIKNTYGRSCFGLAVENEDWEIVRLLVENGVDVDYKDVDNGFSALHKAVVGGCQIDCIEYFLNKGADPNLQVCGKTCLDLALDKRIIDWQIVKLLMEVNADLNYMQNTQILALLIGAVEENQLKMAQYFVRKQTSPWCKLDFKSCFKWQITRHKTCKYILDLFVKNKKRADATFLSSAMDIDFMNRCLGDEINELTAKDLQGKSYFGRAIEGEFWKIVELFMQRGVPVDYRDYCDGCTALYKAIKADEHGYVKSFLSKQAKVNITIDGMTSLDLALSNEKVNWDTVRLLVENGADVNNCRQNERGYTPLHYAVEQSHPDMVNYLINKRADLSIKDDLFGLTPLELAHRLRSLKQLTPENKTCNLITLMLLIVRGIQSPDIPKCASDFMKVVTEEKISLTEISYRGVSCFGSAVQYGFWEFVKQFVEFGVSVNYRDCNESFTALHKAVEASRFDYVKYFLEKRADVNTKVDEMSSLDLALQNKSICWETVKMLAENGADVNCNRNEKGFSPLHYAVEGNRLDMVKYLVNKQADILLRGGSTKQTPLEYARDLKRTNIVGFLTLREEIDHP